VKKGRREELLPPLTGEEVKPLSLVKKFHRFTSSLLHSDWDTGKRKGSDDVPERGPSPFL
jgi:hypothetical protein